MASRTGWEVSKYLPIRSLTSVRYTGHTAYQVSHLEGLCPGGVGDRISKCSIGTKNIYTSLLRGLVEEKQSANKTKKEQ